MVLPLVYYLQKVIEMSSELISIVKAEDLLGVTDQM